MAQGFPQHIQLAAESAAGALAEYFDLADITMGGGTVLQARWGHRESFDIDFFCKGAAFARVHRRFGADVERAMVDRAGSDPSRTWMEYMALYCEIEGIETTLMPHEFILAESHDGVLPGGVPVRLQSTAEILAKKLRHRLHGAGAVEVRDVYDLAFAVRFVPEAFAQAKQSLSPAQRSEVSTMLAHLPKGWSGQTTKPLAGQAEPWSEAEMAESLRSALGSCPPTRSTRGIGR